MPWRDFTDPVLDTLRDARDAAFPGGESRSRTVLSGMGLAVVACGLLLLAGLVIFSPGPPSQNVTGSTLPQVVVTSAMTVPTVTIPVTARPPAVTSTTARPSTTTTAVSAPTTIAPATTGHRPATASEAAAVAQEVPPPAGYVITDMQAEGIWLAVTERADFTSYLQQHGGNLTLLSGELHDRASAIRTVLAMAK